ncbi:MAG: large-conductance mechanosensitive channel protein MscL [Candidatus Sericytochromatia bacterium]
MKLIEEFKEFAIKGNVIDLAVGVIIGGAFGKITNSLVSDIFMPPLGLLISGVDFKHIAIPLKPELTDGAGKVLAEAVTIKIGSLIQVCIEFALMAFAIFLMVKVINHLKRSQEAVPVVVVEAPAPSREELLLSEIRDLLAARPTA